MIRRSGALAIIVGIVIASRTFGVAEDVMPSWYPLNPGDTWVYQKESLDGDMVHPVIERWTTEETIVSAVKVPELAGALVTKKTKVLSDFLAPGYLRANDWAKRELPESHLLIRRNCVYLLDGLDAQGSGCDFNVESTCLKPLDQDNHVRPEYRDDLLRGKIPADFCFPMQSGKTWGKVPHTSPAEEYVWRVDGLNADPFGPPGGKTFHLSTHLGAGDFMDRWFTEGVGVVQQVMEHHGTYGEDRWQLLRATISGKTQRYQLTAARTVPLGDSDCRGPGWRHYSRFDGSSFRSMADCIAYSSKRK
jgi:hypothetical protein